MLFPLRRIVYGARMHHPFVPLLVLLVALAGLAAHFGVLERRPVWWGLVVLAAGAAAAGAWAGGVDFAVLKRVKLILTALVAALVLMRHWRAGPLARRRVYLGALAVAAGLSWVVHFNFFAFHGTGGQRVYMHLHEIAHYYLGSKYAPELGYGELYTAMLRAEAERYHDHFTTLEARDLHTNRLVDIRALLRRSGAVKERFTPERWRTFTEDVAFFRDALGTQYSGILRDHGYNPSPLWTLIGGSIANLVPAGSGTGILLLTLLDPLLEAGIFLAILWAFGAEVALLSMLYFCLLFGASFGWLGGAFLRHMWLFGAVVAVCCMRRNRYLLAGALLAGATLLRIFPAFLLAGAGARAAADWWAGRGVRTHHLQMFASFAAVALLLLGATGLGRGRGGDWLAFRDNLQLHMQNTAFNTIGLTQILAYPGLPAFSTPGTEAREGERRHTIYVAQLCTVFPLALLWFARRSRRETDVGATAMAIALLFVGLDLACYYYLVQMLLILAHRDRLDRIALLFTIEVATYALLLFEDRDAAIFFYRNVLVLFLLIALYVDPIAARGWRFAATLRRRAHA